VLALTDRLAALRRSLSDQSAGSLGSVQK